MNSTQLLGEFKNEFGTNQRLRVGIWSILGILMLYACLSMNDVLTSQKAEYDSLQSTLGDLQNLSEQTFWGERASLTTSLRSQVSSELWQSSSQGLAQASFQTWLEQQLAITRITEARVQMLPVELRSGVIDLWQVTARVQSNVNPRDVHRLLYLLESHQKLVVVDELAIYNHRIGALDMQVTAWFGANDD